MSNISQYTIPDGPEAITAAWLTRVLREGGAIADAVVTAAPAEPIGRDRGFTGRIARLRLSYDRPEPGAPRTLIAKLPTADPALRVRFVPSYQREIGFYADIAPLSRLRTPRCYHSAIDPATGAYILLLEDLAPARPGDQVAGCSAEDVEVAARELATFQAAWWEHPRLDHLAWLTAANDQAGMQRQLYQMAMAVFAQKFRGLVTERFTRLAGSLGRNFISYRDQLSRRPFTIVHGDFRLDNLFFGTSPGDAPVMVVDWQLVTRGRGASDLGYFMGMCLPANRRREIEEAVLATYHAVLLDNGVRGYSLDECQHDYRLGMLRLLNILLIAGAFFDFSSERGRRLVEASLQSCEEALVDHHLDDLMAKWEREREPVT